MSEVTPPSPEKQEGHVLFVVGVVLLAAGSAGIYWPLGLIVPGVACIVLGVHAVR